MSALIPTQHASPIRLTSPVRPECTFLILDRAYFEATGDEIAALIGDTNLFLQPGDCNDDDEHDETNDAAHGDTPPVVAEAEIMIAEAQARGQRRGWEAMLLMLAYGAEAVRCTRFVAKIGLANVRSIAMFERMHFAEVSRSEVFGEVTLERRCTAEWRKWLQDNVSYEIKEYK